MTNCCCSFDKRMTHYDLMGFFKKKSITDEQLIQLTYEHDEFMACVDAAIYVVKNFELPLDHGWFVLKGFIHEMMANNKHLKHNTNKICFTNVFLHFYYEKEDFKHAKRDSIRG